MTGDLPVTKYYSPNKSQIRSAVKGADRHDYYRRHRIPLLRIALALLFFSLIGFVFLFGILDWSK
jgi:hypothetical protein